MSTDGGGVAQAAIKGVLGSLGGGGMPGMGLSVGTSSGATSGDAGQSGSGTGEDFAVNFGHGVSQGGGVSSWVWIAALAAGALFVLKTKGKG
jgi:hypothetical protein